MSEQPRTDPAQYRFEFIHELQWDHERIGKFEVYIPNADLDGKKVADYHNFVKLILGEKQVVLKKIQQNNRKGRASVHPSLFKDKEDPATKVIPCVIAGPATEKEWITYKNKQIPFFESALFPFLIGLAGLWVDAAFGLGKIKVMIPVSTTWALIWAGIGFILKAVAIYLLFIKNRKEVK